MIQRDLPRVLVVDDDVIVRTLLARRLEAAGYTVQTADDGCLGVEQVRCWRPAVLLTDCMMPGLDGPALVAAIRAIAGPTRPYIILLSSRPTELGGADATLLKPWADDELLACVARGVAAHAWEPAAVGGCG